MNNIRGNNVSNIKERVEMKTVQILYKESFTLEVSTAASVMSLSGSAALWVM